MAGASLNIGESYMYDHINVSVDDLDAAVVAASISDDEIKAGFKSSEQIAPGVTFHYGVEDGKVFGYLHQEGLADLLTYCKEMREKSAAKSHKMNMEDPLAEDYIIPMVLKEAIKWETNGHVDADEIAKSGDPMAWEPLDKIIETQYRAFKLTNRVIWRPKKQKMMFKP